MKAAQGTALVELALIVPVLVVILLYSLYFTEVLRAKLALLQATRFAAWEMTSHALSDFGTGDVEAAFQRAGGRSTAEATSRFQQAWGDRGAATFVASTEDFQVRISRAGRRDPTRVSGPSEAGGWAGAIFGATNIDLDTLLGSWKLNTARQIRADASIQLRNRFLPRNFLERSGRGFFGVDVFGGRSLATLSLRSHLSVIADGWALPDGADSTMRGGRAGAHRTGSRPSGLYTQVSRMTFLGIRSRLENVPGLTSISRFLRSAAPDPTGTFVVSHNYAPDPQEPWNRGCGDHPGYPSAATGGLNNLARFSKLDAPRPSCFDTAPFRDQSSYADSLYIRMFEARGSWFMGCKSFGADDPSSSADRNAGDESQKVDCG